jgi:hypothetical protein
MNPTTNHRAVCALLLVLSQACGNAMRDEPLDHRLSELEGELHRHHGVTLGAATLNDVVNEANRYHTNMMGLMDDLGDSMGTMSRCSDTGMGTMHDHMSAMSTEMHRHWSTLRGAGDLSSARTECASHVAEMHDMIWTMHDTFERSHCRMMGP